MLSISLPIRLPHLVVVCLGPTPALASLFSHLIDAHSHIFNIDKNKFESSRLEIIDTYMMRSVVGKLMDVQLSSTWRI